MKYPTHTLNYVLADYGVNFRVFQGEGVKNYPGDQNVVEGVMTGDAAIEVFGPTDSEGLVLRYARPTGVLFPPFSSIEDFDSVAVLKFSDDVDVAEIKVQFLFKIRGTLSAERRLTFYTDEDFANGSAYVGVYASGSSGGVEMGFRVGETKNILASIDVAPDYWYEVDWRIKYDSDTNSYVMKLDVNYVNVDVYGNYVEKVDVGEEVITLSFPDEPHLHLLWGRGKFCWYGLGTGEVGYGIMLDNVIIGHGEFVYDE